MMDEQLVNEIEADDQLVEEVLACANRVAGTALSLPPGGDVALEAFAFDSLSLFAFILELERTCGIQLDDAILHHDHLLSVRSAAALVASRRAGAVREG